MGNCVIRGDGTSWTSRRGFLVGASALAGQTAATGRASASGSPILLVGDQNSSLRSLLDAAGEGAPTDYRIEWKEFTQAQPLLQAQNAGAIDFCRAGDVAFLFAYAAGAPIVAIGANLTGGQGAAILVRADSAFATVRDLKGRQVILSPAGLGEPLLYGHLAQAGLAPGDVHVVHATQNVAQLSLATGQVDAWVTWQPYIALGQEIDHDRILVDGQGVLSFYVFGIAHRNALETKRAAIIDLQHRIARAMVWARAHRDLYGKTLARVSRMPDAVAQRSVESSRLEEVAIDDRVVHDTTDLYQKLSAYGLIKKGLDIKKAFDPTVLNGVL
ncbi:nitrate/sulfonate/bicarbonate ABC transporter substrate-binding periplasmic protein [Acetobacter nitrogenifigens DSM 23921 = NBRC 105050]|uniref:ABC transporter substrate-binding protein n=2 Tax=Acetobacter nitrogenifigens TaxID=285268 RepID=A0A511XF94_9PROT|nr:nitrate/sulfonate/bicarbonate ABC transporter substrate-binding periplasmic protein [Acetobacter nitrogenifigens DSM 23921 = NBRC 105050]GEN61619.1 ABC transporter substrate-binding protein [Acetobacter nitrogenifigens DSM 23921 = NBRC 105050]